MYTRQYKDFRGVDFSSARAECAPTRFNDLKNMWRDYHSEQGAAVETAPGFRALFNVPGEVHSLHYLPSTDEGKGKYIVHAGTSLFTASTDGAEQTPIGKDLNDSRSQSALFYNSLYLVDGKKYCRVSDGVLEAGAEKAYVPTTFLDGEPYEQKNLLTDRFWEIYTKPSYEERGTYYYSFHEILRSFDNNTIETIFILADGSTVTNIYPFITKTPDADGWDYGIEFSSSVLPDTPVDYSVGVKVGTAVRERDGASSLFFYYETDAQKHFLGFIDEVGDGYYSHIGNYGIRFTIAAKDGAIEGGTVGIIDSIFFGDGQKVRFYVSEDTAPFTFDYSEDLEVQLASWSRPSTFVTVGDVKPLTGNEDFPEGYSTQDAINKCTLITEFDGRLFLSGNPDLPNSVFYTQRDLTGYNNPFYIGCYNYLNDGTGKTPITAMITTPTQLIVLKDDVAQGAAIYYHYAQDNPSQDKVTADLQPRIYPRENGVPGVGCLGMACNFLDDPVFLSPKGLEAIGKSQVNLERTVTHRSSLVDARLCNENLRRAVYAEWDGYLCILVPGGRMYLADSRQISEVSGSAQYEWYYLDDIGVYAGQKNRYHYVTGSTLETIDGLQVGHKPSGLYERNYVPDDATVLTEGEGENTVGYVIEGEYAYIVESDGEQTGGVFKEATALLAVDGMLLFGCADGTVCMMNTDMRDERGFISQDAYKHNGRGYESYCCLCSDTCGVENATKSTVSGSFVVKCKAFPETGVSVSVRTNEIEWEDVDRIVVGRVDLSRMSFLGFTFNTMRENTALVREKEKRWVEKQVAFHDYCYMSPFGLLSATYDYKIAGKVRMR